MSMGSFSDHFDEFLAEMPATAVEQMRKANRVQKVRDMWEHLVEPFFLDHTNNVFVFQRDGRVEMHVYVDESIYAAELNNRRELIKWRCLEEYGEAIDEFHIHISKGEYKNNHPFVEKQDSRKDDNPPLPLSDEELEMVDIACAGISEQRLRECFREAMISDLEWKKANRQ